MIIAQHIVAVVVTFNRKDVLRRALQAILEQTRPLEAVVVVDNASEDGTAEMVTEKYPGVYYRRLEDNMGFAAGLAAGMRFARENGADYIWLMDDDSVPEPAALERLVQLCQKIEGCGIIGLNGGAIRHGSPNPRQRLEPIEAPGKALAYDADFVLVDGSLVTSDVVNDVGYPREDFFMMMEDVEYTWRVRRAGWRVVLYTEDLIKRSHLGSGGSAPGGTAPPWRGYYQSRNHLAMALGHRSPAEVGTWALRQAKFIVAAVWQGDQKWQRVSYRVRGAVDALRGRMGRTLEPER